MMSWSPMPRESGVSRGRISLSLNKKTAWELGTSSRLQTVCINTRSHVCLRKSTGVSLPRPSFTTTWIGAPYLAFLASASSISVSPAVMVLITEPPGLSASCASGDCGLGRLALCNVGFVLSNSAFLAFHGSSSLIWSALCSFQRAFICFTTSPKCRRSVVFSETGVRGSDTELNSFHRLLMSPRTSFRVCFTRSWSSLGRSCTRLEVPGLAFWFVWMNLVATADVFFGSP
mmetsp:Transcript_21318/g.61614  ORF Transcript_21318/g.61614 Transcript_21318/m.61614 type:complete len:231 (-) Transcript_21318:160-852(-)